MPMVLAALVALLLGTAGPASAAELSILYSGNLNGELEPCGCSEESNLGGILRRATIIDRLRAERPDLIAISNGGLLDWTTTTDTIKNRFILKGFAQLGYDAVGVQWRDPVGVLADLYGQVEERLLTLVVMFAGLVCVAVEIGDLGVLDAEHVGDPLVLDDAILALGALGRLENEQFLGLPVDDPVLEDGHDHVGEDGAVFGLVAVVLNDRSKNGQKN